MKKITLIAAAFIAVSFASCSKAKTCTCTTTTTSNNGYTTTTTTDVKSYDKLSSGDANAACPKSTTSTGSGEVTTCVLS